MGENRRKDSNTLYSSLERGCQSDIFTNHLACMGCELRFMKHVPSLVCFVALVIQGGAMAKFWPLHHYNQCMGENRRKTLSTARGRGGASTRYLQHI